MAKHRRGSPNTLVSFDAAVRASDSATAMTRLPRGNGLSVQREGDSYYVLFIRPASGADAGTLTADVCMGRSELVALVNRVYGVSLTGRAWRPSINNPLPTGAGMGQAIPLVDAADAAQPVDAVRPGSSRP